MNDRFKFRVWNIKHGIYCDQMTEMVINSDGVCYDNGVSADYFEYNGFVIEQCTGLKDKIGNLIYENDRVGFYVYGQDEEWHAQQGTVIWYNSCWGVETSSRFIQFENELTIKNPKDIEIIGNIHEQPEQGRTK